MDAANPSAVPTFASCTHLRIGATALAVRDLDRVTRYYRDLLGLAKSSVRPTRCGSALAACRFSRLNIGPTSSRTIHARPVSTTTLS